MKQNVPRGRLDAGTSHDAHAPTRFFDVSVEDLSVAAGELVASGRLTVRNVTGRPLDVALRLLGAWDRDHGPRTRPSQGTTLGYTVDENNIQWTQVNLKKFIKDFADQSQAENIYLVAHSMGNRALTVAVKELV